MTDRDLHAEVLAALADQARYTDDLARVLGTSPGKMAIVVSDLIAAGRIAALGPDGFTIIENVSA